MRILVISAFVLGTLLFGPMLPEQAAAQEISSKKAEILKKQAGKSRRDAKLVLAALKGKKAAQQKYPKRGKKPKVSGIEKVYGKGAADKLKKLSGRKDKAKLEKALKRLEKENEKKLKDLKKKGAFKK